MKKKIPIEKLIITIYCHEKKFLYRSIVTKNKLCQSIIELDTNLKNN
jgi:hypothetical protein